MFEFSKKDTPIANLTFISIMAAINVIFALLFAFIPYVIVILILILPLTSVLVGLFCQKRYYPIYIIVTLGLCFVSAIWDISIPLFYILPSMITGFIFALFVTIKVPNIYLIFLTSLIQMAFSYLAILFSKFILQIDIINTFQNLLALQQFDLFYVIVPSFIFIVSLIQSVFSYMIIKDELPKFGYKFTDKKDNKYYLLYILSGSFISCICVLIFAFLRLDVAYLMMFISLLFSLEITIYCCLEKKIINFILYGIFLIITLLTFAICYQYMAKGSQFLIFEMYPFMCVIHSLVNKYLLTKNKKYKIKHDEDLNG